MKRIKFTESQIVKALKANEQGRKVEDICRELGIHQSTFYNWRNKYSGMESSQLKRLKELGRGEPSFKTDVCRHKPGQPDA